MRDDNPYHVGALDLGLRVIAMLSSRDSVSIGDVVRAAGVSRATAHRCLRTLEARGFVTLSSTGRGYFVGSQLLGIATDAILDPLMRPRHRAVLADLRERTGESVHTAVLLGARVLVVDGRRSIHDDDIGVRVGMTAWAHALAAGKLLLAAYNDEQVAALLPPDPLPQPGASTIRTASDLRTALEETRRRGWARALQESEPGVCSLAVPLDGSHWRDRVALVVSVPATRGSMARIDELAAAARTVVAVHARRGSVRPWRLDRGRPRGLVPGGISRQD
ncbi:IclR family transcriptional regulator [Microbacterium sp. 179-B 1A2 NHS]|uniref:IclR family transcriptional regulator n=1 Tax=Microbacterium sp. 179-B 1A2 NHS TaxID=3142383 RepID=UPI0039A2648C